MFQIIVVFAGILAVLVLPVMLAARLVGAARTGFGAALVAVILQLVLSVPVRRFIADESLVLGVEVVAGAAIFSLVLGTTLLKGLVVSIVATVLSIIAMALLAGAFAAAGGMV